MIDVGTMYSKIQTDQTFGFKEYKINPEYLDPRKQMILRQLQRRKSNRKVIFAKNKKPCFMDQYLRHIKFVPGPGSYPISKSLTEKNISKFKRKIDPKLTKNTYLQKIQFNEKNKKATPPVGIYQITKSLQKQHQQSLQLSQRKIPINQKRHPLDNFITLSSQVPGVGQYNLTEIKKLHQEYRDQSYYIQKTKSQQKLRKSKSSKPDFLKYQPIPQMYKTFTKLSVDTKRYNSLWTHGTIDKRPTSTGFLVSPGPAAYSLINKWQKDQIFTKQNKYVKLFDKISKGHQANIYH